MGIRIDPVVVAQVKTAIDNASRVLVITHVSPDGDALGALTAVGLILEQKGKEKRLVCDDGSLQRFRFLELSSDIQIHPGDEPFDLVISVDCGDISRMGTAFETIPEPVPTLINIDHHVTNTRFGDINLIDENATSTTEILFASLELLEARLTPALATSLLTGLVTDTLCFRTVGVTPFTLEAASRMMEAGADLANITMRSLLLKPISSLQLWGMGLKSMRLENGFLWTSITNAEREASGYLGSGTTGLVNALGDIYQADIGAVLMELPDGRVSVSFRCRPPFSVAELARDLGGGGHDLAAGCTLDGPLASAEDVVVSMSKETIRSQRAHWQENGRL